MSKNRYYHLCVKLIALLMLISLYGCSSSSDNNSSMSNDDQPEQLITRDSYVEIMNHVFDLYVGDRYNKPFLMLTDVDFSSALLSEDRIDGTFHRFYNCASGSAEQDFNPTSTNAGAFYTSRFDSCRHGGILYEGEISSQDGGFLYSFTSDSFILQFHPELITTFSGQGKFTYSASTLGPQHSWNIENFALSSRTIDGDLVIDSTSSSFGFSTVGGIDEAWLRGELTIRSDITENKLLTVNIPVELTYQLDLGTTTSITREERNAWNFTSGQLELIADDSSQLLLDANTDDTATVNITISNNSVVESFEAPWSQWQRTLRFDRYPEDAVDWVTPRSQANPSPDTGPAISLDNYNSLLDYVFDLYSGHDHITPLSLAQGILSTDDVQNITRDRGIRTDRIECENGGTALATRLDNDDATHPQDYLVDFDDGCSLAGYQFGGDIRGQELRTAGGAQGLESENLIWIDESGNETRFSGRVSRRVFPENETERCTWETDYMNLVPLTDAEDTVITTFSTQFKALNSEIPSVLLNGTLNVTSAETQRHELLVTIDNLMTQQQSPETTQPFSSGSLTLTAGDGSRLYLGDTRSVPDGVHIVIENSTGRFEIQEPWLSWRTRLPSARLRVCD